MYFYEIAPSLKKKLNKLCGKEKNLYLQVLNKIEEVIRVDDVEHYKNLRYDMKDKKRVHIGHFVLVFRFLKLKNKVIFEDFDHHDNIYKR